MSRFFSERYKDFKPYTPGERPKANEYIKLNTNESPYPPSEKAVAEAAKAAESLNLYSDPDSNPLKDALSELYGIDRDRIIFGNGSDEILSLCFLAFCDKNTPAVFPNISYGFYPVLAGVYSLPYREIPLKDDFSIDINDYMGVKGTIIIANPNAPTSLALTAEQVERILQGNPDNVVVIDEAYVDFGAESCVGLTEKYDNLLVVQTFSKSRSFAGGRLGFGIGSCELISDINTIRNSINPYNINSMTMAMGTAILKDNEYTLNNCRAIMDTRDNFIKEIRKLGFIAADSYTNFVFARHPDIPGEELYTKFRENGILVRHFSKPLIDDYVRISIGSFEQMQKVIDIAGKIVKNN